MTMNNQGRPTTPTSGAGESATSNVKTFTGNKALMIEEGLSFEFGDFAGTGVDLQEPKANTNRLGGLDRNSNIV